jgi:diguanylate cyclase (GGDEF)-like protein
MTGDDENTDRTLVVPTIVLQKPDDPPPGSQGSLVVLAGAEVGREFRLDERENVIGRSPNSTVSIDLPSVSRYHTRIVRVEDQDGTRFEVSDLNSTNGTLVNGARVKTARLAHSDTLQLGDVVFRFVVQDTVEGRFHSEIQHRLDHDGLTGLMKLEPFKRFVQAQVVRGPEHCGPFVLAMTDLDGLKTVNDTHGHLAGSMVVREMGELIRQVLLPDDRAALYGGDEATIFLAKRTPSEARVAAERLRELVETKEFIHCGKTFSVSISQGLAHWPCHGETVEQLIAAADAALYRAKADGRNCVRVAGE